MAKLAITPELLLGAIFQNTQPDLRLRGATYDPLRRVVLLDVDGPGVPDAEEIQAICHRQPPLQVEFKAC